VSYFHQKPPTPASIGFALMGAGIGLLFTFYSAGWAALCPFIGFFAGTVIGAIHNDD
jgi:hypothetical protein